MSFEAFDSLIENCRGVEHIVDIAEKYTPDIPKLIETMTDIRKQLTQKRGPKGTITKIIKKLKKQTNFTDDNDSLTDSASLSRTSSLLSVASIDNTPE